MNYAKQKRRKPKLDRRNAIKNIEYDATDSPTSSYSFDVDHNLTRRGLPGISSFRVDGVDGEFDRICRSLGLSGIEDFSIPVADWEASKSLSPSPNNITSSRYPDNVQIEFDVGAIVRPVDDEAKSTELALVFNVDDRLSRVSERDVHEDDEMFLGGRSRNVIVGLRPPKLASPVVSNGDIDNATSRGGLSETFDQTDNGVDLILTPTEIDQKQDYVVESMSCSAAVVTESCSDSSHDENDNENENDRDSFNLTAEPVFSISPVGSFRRSIGSWQKGDFLGSGSFGTVYEAFTDDGFFFAVKEVSLLDQGIQGRQSVYQLEQEISLLSQFQHENIVQYLGTEKDDNRLYIFLELVTKGSLANLYQKYQLRDSQVSAYTRQILSGLMYLHRRNVVHRDIKCANILVDVSGSVKLADFGLAKATKLNDIKSCKGTAFWMAPEVVNRKNSGYGLPADIWSLGCTVLEMLSSRVPYSHLEGMQALFRIGKGEPPPIPKTLSRDAQDFILKCLRVNPDDRPTASQLLDHPFVKRLSFPSPVSPQLLRTRS